MRTQFAKRFFGNDPPLICRLKIFRFILKSLNRETFGNINIVITILHNDSIINEHENEKYNRKFAKETPIFHIELK